MPDQEAKKIVVLYVGEDTQAKSALKTHFEKYTAGTDYGNQVLSIEPPSTAGTKQFKKIWEMNPDVLYLDFANYAEAEDTFKKFKAMTNLATLLRYESRTKFIPTIALHSRLATESTISRVLFSGVRFNHIKSGELSQAVIQALYTLKEKKVSIEPFALAKIEMDTVFNQDIRIGFTSQDYYRVETNLEMGIGENVKLIKHPFHLALGPIEVSVANPSEGALYYNYRFSYHLEFDEEMRNNEIAERVNIIDKAPKLGLTPKSVRVFAYDPKLEFINDEMPPLHNLPYTIKFQSSMVETLETLRRFIPHIIVVQNVDEKELKELEQYIESIPVYYPHILIFNSKIDNKSEEKKLISKDPLNWDILNRVFLTFEKTQPEPSEKRVFYSSNDPLATAIIPRDVKIKAMTENRVFFETDFELPPFTVLRMKEPLDCLVTTIPLKDEVLPEELKNCHLGLFNCVGENEKTGIRKRINDFFTQDKRAQEEAESQAFFELNQKKSEERKEEEKKNEEEKAQDKSDLAKK